MVSTDRGDSGELPGGPVALVTDQERAEGAEDDAIASTSAPDLIADSLGEYTTIWWRRVRSGESGVLPVVLGLVAIVVYFQIRSSLFLSAGNLVNLMTQSAFIITLGMAEIFVLLLGDIDLAAGASLLMAESVIFGRAAMGEAMREGAWSDRWRLRIGGKLVFAENVRLGGAIAGNLSQAATAAGGIALLVFVAYSLALHRAELPMIVRMIRQAGSRSAA